jgi:hypothetical protein
VSYEENPIPFVQCGYTYEVDDRCQCVEERGHPGMHKCLHERAAEKLNKILAQDRLESAARNLSSQARSVYSMTTLHDLKETTMIPDPEHVTAPYQPPRTPYELNVHINPTSAATPDVHAIAAALRKQTDINSRQQRHIDYLERRLVVLEAKK